ncbi:polysaccharide pyruvyl transferase family protein [Haliangium sp.]|uniref:polysaccharide pyruvyl transferase family protein n=1 Tax=Haliangium sp. TaxID=2663208 RepID=UPI003D0E9AD1
MIASWCRIPSRPNFGDALTPWLIERITGRPPRFLPPGDARPKHFVTGSVIALAGSGDTVWGAGILSRDDTVSPDICIRAVRGPLTRRRARACGADCPEVYGDPALLLPRFYRPPPGPRRGVGVVPHFSDMPRLAAAWPRSDELRLIDIQAPITDVIDAIAECELVASSSLHGIIAGHAYGVPAVWLKFGDLPSGDDSKFHDYSLAVGLGPAQPLRLGYGEIATAALQPHATLPARIDTEPLWRACPFAPQPGGAPWT